MTPTSYILGPDRRGRCALVQGDRWLWLGRGEPPGRPRAERLPCPHAEIQPGRVNAHTHLYSGAVPFGITLPTPAAPGLLPILTELWWRLDRALDHATLKASVRAAVADALLCGTTTVFDHHESPRCIDGSLDVVADACRDLGLRALLAYGATERNAGPEEAYAGLRESQRLCRRPPPGIRGCLGLHAGFTVRDDTLSTAGQLAAELGTVVHVHVAEDPEDGRFARERGHQGALSRLLAQRAVPPGSILAHGIDLSQAEIAWADKTGLWLVHNPRSNAANGLPYARVLRHARRVALGSDGHPGPMTAELAKARELGAACGESPKMALHRLRAGWDLASERLGLALGVPLPDRPATADIVAMAGQRAVHVLVGGRLVVRDGALVTGSESAIRRQAQAAAATLNQAMART
ncbi:MAG: amidohydrolase family protein [Deltaproteobacteria bacterium]|nr:amidohydrolase family protein [Deltaproteobacteria bacterium]